jgi:O-antigen/teichoic acid export membrane protein
MASLALIIANLFVIFLYDIPSSERVEKVRFNETVLHYFSRAVAIMAQCWPIFIVMFLTVFSLNIPRYFIDKFHPSEIGYFGILAMPVTLIVLVMSFILQPNVVELALLYTKREYAKFKSSVWKIVEFTTIIGVVVLLGAWLIGVWALGLIFGISFENYTVALMLIIVGAILNAYIAIFVNVFVIMRRFKEQFFVLLTTNALLACVAGSIIQTTGLIGAILLFVITSGVQALFLIIYFTAYLTKQSNQNEKN